MTHTLRALLCAAIAALAISVAPQTASPADAASCVKIYKIYYDSPGSDYGSNSSLNGEWIQLKNVCATSKNLNGFKLRDVANHWYYFSTNYTLGAGKLVKIHTGSGSNTSTDRYMNRGWYVWNNTSDTAYLYNSSGTRIRTCSYTTSSALPKAASRLRIAMGGLRFRKSLKIAPGIRLSVSKSGLDQPASVALATRSTLRAERTTSFGVPGSGAFLYVETHGGGSGRSTGQRRAGSRARTVAVEGAMAAQLLRFGFFAGAAEKRYREGLVAYLSRARGAAATAFEATIAADQAVVSAHLFAALSIDAKSALAAVVGHLEVVVGSRAPFSDRLLVKFLPPETSTLAMEVRVTELISARVSFDPVGATLLLAEAYQESGEPDRRCNRPDPAAARREPGRPCDPTVPR